MTESPDNRDEITRAGEDLRRLEPPGSLEERVVRRVIEKDPRRMYRLLAAVIAGLALLGTGWMLRGIVSDTPASTAANRYVLLLFPSLDEPALTPETEASRVSEYARWAREEGARGRVLEGHKLAGTSTALNVDAGTHSGLEGYFVVAASSLDEAVEIARTCPHATHGGHVEVRPIEN